jgi:PadR family transcriptional regulator PadR
VTDPDKFNAVRKGLLEFAILRIVSGERVYVADIIARLAGAAFAAQEGTLYPLLSKLRRDGLVDYEWVESGAGPPRKYYRLTDKGGAHLADFTAYWRQLNDTLDHLGQDNQPGS